MKRDFFFGRNEHGGYDHERKSIEGMQIADDILKPKNRLIPAQQYYGLVFLLSDSMDRNRVRR